MTTPHRKSRHPSHARYAHHWRPVRQFLRTPKGLLIVVLTVLTAVSARVEGVRLVAPGVASAVGAAMILDAPLLRWWRGRWAFPSGALLTGLLIADILSGREAWFVFAAASVIGIAGKYLVRTRAANVFNPAALGLVAVFYLFDTAQNWWGAMISIVPGASWPLLLGTGVYVTHRVNKVPLVVAFLAVYFALFAAATFVLDPGEVAEVFVGPDLIATVFLASFMLTDPPTSPTRIPAQIVCGSLVAAASVGIFVGIGAAHYLLGGLMIGNVFEGVRRHRQARRARLAAAA